eukprot:6315171-Alexandrium_andersonii.AAC.1
MEIHFMHRPHPKPNKQGEPQPGVFIAGCPTCNPQSAQDQSVLQFASIRNPPFRKGKIASG